MKHRAAVNSRGAPSVLCVGGNIMRAVRLVAAVLLAVAVVHVRASGPVGIYGIIERVVFEPDETSPERVQLWGAFAYVDGAPAGSSTLTTSSAARGYLYFRLPTLYPEFPDQTATIRAEWRDLKSVAGTGTGVGFGRWGYIGGFGALRPDARPGAPSVILSRRPSGGDATDLRVRPPSEAPATPAVYETNTGVVKLTDASHAAILERLRTALAR